MAVAVRIAPFGKYRKLINDLGRIEKSIYGVKTDKALQTLAETGRDFIVTGINSQRSGWKALSEITKFLKGHDRILVDHGDFVGAMQTWKEGQRWYAGIPEGATGSKGQDLELVGAVQEEGATIPVSDKMRKFFAAKGFPLRADTKYLMVPPRPWFAPAVEELEVHADEVLEPLVDDFLSELG